MTSSSSTSGIAVAVILLVGAVVSSGVRGSVGSSGSSGSRSRRSISSGRGRNR